LILWRALRLISEEDFRKPWVFKLGWLLEGWSEQEGLAALRWVAEAYIRPTALAETIARLRDHVARGDAVFLVSAMLKPTLRVIGDLLGVTDVVGTEVEINEGRFTGVVSARVCMGIEKQRLARETIAARGLDIDFANSYAYADSISDLPLFEMVGHPVAVYPDKELFAHARAKNWEILQETRTEESQVNTPGTITKLQICAQPGAPMQDTPTARGVTDLGLEGDSHAKRGSARQVLLMDEETLAAFGLTPGRVRENITTRGLGLHELAAGARVRSGSVVLEITKHCTPCEFIEDIQPGLREKMQGHRGMLARVIEGGELRVGDAIEVVK
jgi:HAD superfamily hydrolase (TIGR01490 family)